MPSCCGPRKTDRPKRKTILAACRFSESCFENDLASAQQGLPHDRRQELVRFRVSAASSQSSRRESRAHNVTRQPLTLCSGWPQGDAAKTLHCASTKHELCRMAIAAVDDRVQLTWIRASDQGPNILRIVRP